MRILKLTLAYDGTQFVGWQRQAAGESIQGVLEEALARFEGGPVTVHGAGRTDAGVHALGQVASAVMTCDHDAATLTRALNAQLPRALRVLSVEEAPSEFNARFSARSKMYRYVLRTGNIASPFDRAYTWHVPEPFDVDAVGQAARLLVGTHDFAAFQSAGSDTQTTVRTIMRSELVTWGEGLLAYEVAGDGFLRHMVRAIVGTLVEVGHGARRADSVADLLGRGSRTQAGPTAPARGLFLVRVDYY